MTYLEKFYLKADNLMQKREIEHLKAAKLAPVFLDDSPVEEVRFRRIVIDDAPPPVDLEVETADSEDVTVIWAPGKERKAVVKDAEQPEAKPVTVAPAPERPEQPVYTDTVAYIETKPAPDALALPARKKAKRSFLSFLLRCTDRLKELRRRRDYVRGIDAARRILKRVYEDMEKEYADDLAIAAARDAERRAASYAEQAQTRVTDYGNT